MRLAILGKCPRACGLVQAQLHPRLGAEPGHGVPGFACRHGCQFIDAGDLRSMKFPSLDHGHARHHQQIPVQLHLLGAVVAAPAMHDAGLLPLDGTIGRPVGGC